MGITIRGKVLTITMGIALLITSLLTVNYYNYNQSIEQKIIKSKDIMTEDFTYYYLFYLFDQVISNPTDGNISALYEALRNKEGQLQAYLVLSLTEDQMDKKFKKDSKLSILDYHLTSEKLLRFDINNSENTEKIKQIKEVWELFIQDTGGPTRYWEEKDPMIITDAYIKLSDRSEMYFSYLE